METEIFICKYFKFGENTIATGVSQSNVRNFLACTVNYRINKEVLSATGCESVRRRRVRAPRRSCSLNTVALSGTAKPHSTELAHFTLNKRPHNSGQNDKKKMK